MNFPYFSKKALFAAAVFIGCASVVSAEYYNGSERFSQYADMTIELDLAHGTPGTILGQLVTGTADPGGTLIKSGGGEIWVTAAAGGIFNLHDANSQIIMAPMIPPPGIDWAVTLQPGDQDMLADPAQSWCGGELVVSSGTLVLRGYVNTWVDVGDEWNAIVVQLANRGGGFNPYSLHGAMTGVSNVTVNSGGTLDLSNSFYMGTNMVAAGSNKVFSFLNNVRAGTSHDQIAATIVTGNGNYQLDLHVTDRVGSVGILRGSANVFKTGTGILKVLGDVEFDGNITAADYSGSVFIAGGSLLPIGRSAKKVSTDDPSGVLKENGFDYAYGHALWNAASVNIAGTADVANLSGSANTTLSEEARQGAEVRFRTVNITEQAGITIVDVRENYFARPDVGTLVIEGNQLIKNFQSLFAMGAAATDATASSASAIQNAADAVKTDAPIITGTGVGSYLAIAEGATLGIYQEAGKGGIYKGSVCGVDVAKPYMDADGNRFAEGGTGRVYAPAANPDAKGGTIVKYGAGDLALIFKGANYESLVVLEGRVVSNVEGINLNPGSYDWDKGGWATLPGLRILGTGEFTIIENDANTLKTRLEVASGADLRFSSYAPVATIGGNVDASNNFRSAGTIEISEEQRFVTGNVYAEGGIELVLSATELYAGDKITDDSGKQVIEFSGGSFGLAKAVIVWGDTGEPGLDKHSKISFNGTNQIINNLTGDSLGELVLGVSTLTWNVNSTDMVAVGNKELQYGTFNGTIAPSMGNILKIGTGMLALGGGTKVGYYGLLAIADGGLAASKQNTLQNTSALILNNGMAASFSESQTLTSLYGGKGSVVDIAGDGAVLTLGEVASRTAFLDSAESLDTFSTLVTNRLDNDPTLMRIGMTVAVFDAYFKPIKDFYTSGVKDAKGIPVMTERQWEAFRKYFLGQNLLREDWTHLNYMFGRDLGGAETITRSDVTSLYLSLLAKTTFGAAVADPVQVNPGVDEIVSGVVVGDIETMVERLAFDGSLSVANIRKTGETHVALSGKVTTNSIAVDGGSIELDWDATLAGVVPSAETKTVAVAGTIQDGITVNEGASFGINTAGAVNVSGEALVVTLNERITGRGDFKKYGAGKLVLGENVLYSGETHVIGGDLEMTLRNVPLPGVVDAPFAQTAILVNSLASTLILNQPTDVVWNGEMSNGGHLEKIGVGTLTLTKIPTIAGNITVTAGKLIVPGFVPAATGSLTIAEDAVYELNADTDLVFGGQLLGGGTFRKNGIGALTMNGAASSFSGLFEITKGSVSIVTKNLFPKATMNVGGGAQLSLLEDQIFADLQGSGDITIDGGKTLTLAMSNPAVTLHQRGGSYTTFPETLVGATGFSGQILHSSNGGADSATFCIDGVGALRFAGTIGEGVDIAVVKGQLIADASTINDRKIMLSDKGEIIFNVDAGTSVIRSGAIIGSGSSTSTDKIGKIGGGVFSVEGGQLQDSDLMVYAGTLKVTGDRAFAFAQNNHNAAIAKDAVLEFDYSGSDLKLNTIEGSGILHLVNDNPLELPVITLNGDGSSMRDPVADAEGRFFNGQLQVSGISLIVNLADSDLELCSIGTDAASSLTINKGIGASHNLTFRQEHDTAIRGAFNSDTQIVSVVGKGRLAITRTDATGIFLINNGSLQVDATATLGKGGEKGVLIVENEANIYFSSENVLQGTVSDSILGVVVSSAGTYFDDPTRKVTALSLVKTGSFDAQAGDTETNIELDFSNVQDGGRQTLSLDEDLWRQVTAGTVKITLGVDQGSLVLSGLTSETSQGVKQNLNSSVLLSTSKNPVNGKTGTLEFHVANQKATDYLYTSVTGNGDVLKSGRGLLNVMVSQKYTGATTVKEGAIAYAPGTSLKTDVFNVLGGATLKGGISLVGVKMQTVTEVTTTITADTIVKVTVDKVYREGVLTTTNIVSTQTTPNIGGLRPHVDTVRTKKDWVFGGAFNLAKDAVAELDIAKGEYIGYSNLEKDASGNKKLPIAEGATVKLSGSVASTRGSEMLVLKALNSDVPAFTIAEMKRIGESLTNESSALMISQTSAGTISAYAIQDSFANIGGVTLRDGLAGSFTDVLDALGSPATGKDFVIESELLQNTGSPIGAALNKSTTATLATDIANLSPIALSSMISMTFSGFENDIAYIAQRTNQRRYDAAYVGRDIGPEFFALAQTDLTTNSSGSKAANYDYNTYGALIGFDNRLNDFSTIGFALGANYGRADIHDGGGKINMDDYRATLFASGRLFDGTYFFDAGVQFGMANFDVKRNTLVGENKGDTDSWNAGLFFNIGRGFLLASSGEGDYQFHFAPYAGVSYTYGSVDGFQEHGSASALAVDDFNASSVKGRLGFAVYWLFPLDDWKARLSLDVGYEHEFLDDQTDIDGQFIVGNSQKFSVGANTFSKDAFSAGPTISVDLSETTSLFMGYSVQYGTNEQFVQNLNIGFRRTF